MSGRARRVLVYTAALLLAPLPVMPYARGTREFALALLLCGAALTLSSLYVARGESALKNRGPLGNKLLAASLVTLTAGFGMFVGAIVYLALSQG
jgi:hypothetical protein